jgi:twitching motility protein PilT
MQMGQGKFGMQTMNQSLAGLVSSKVISMEVASVRSPDVEELKKLVMNKSSAANPERKAMAS